MKKILSFFAVLLLPICFMPVRSESSESFDYRIQDGTAVIVSYSGSDRDLSIPFTLNGYEVVGIGPDAFTGNERLEKVTMPSSIIFIGERAFSDCRFLTVVNISSGLKRIGDEAFKNCTALSYFTLPGPLESIGQKAFAGCLNISYIHDITDGYLTKVGSGAFDDTQWFTNFRGDYVTICQGCLLLKYRGNEISPSLPWDIVSIAEDAFAGNTDTEELILPNYLTGLQTGAISDMPSLISVSGGAGLLFADDFAFKNLPKLSSVQLDKVELESENFLDCPLSPYGSEYSGPYDTEIPDESDLRFVSEYDAETDGVVIMYCKEDAVNSDGSLVIPDRIRGKRVTAIGAGACQNRNDIRELYLPEFLTVIRSWAFAYDHELSTVVFPDRLRIIEADAFTDCDIANHIPDLKDVAVDPRAFYLQGNNNIE